MAGSKVVLSDCAVSAVVLGIRPGARKRLGLSDEVLIIWAALVHAARVLADDTDTRTIQQRIDDLFSLLSETLPEVVMERLPALTEELERSLPSWQRYLTKPQARTFLRRCLGGPVYTRLVQAAIQDVAVLSVAGRRGLRAVLPYGAAIDGVSQMLPDGQRAHLASPYGANIELVQFAVKVDEALDRIFSRGDLSELSNLRPDEREGLRSADAEQIAQHLQEVVSGRARQGISEVSAALTRKVDGARAALDHSPDAISQSANSLIELIDRLLRGTFTDAEVMAWCAAYYSDWPGLTYEKNTNLLPTVLAKALCFAYAGRDVDQRSVLPELTALSLRQARTELQRLKHADSDDPDEQSRDRDAVRLAMVAIEGYFHIAINAMWSRVGSDELSQLRQRFAS